MTHLWTYISNLLQDVGPHLLTIAIAVGLYLWSKSENSSPVGSVRRRIKRRLKKGAVYLFLATGGLLFIFAGKSIWDTYRSENSEVEELGATTQESGEPISPSSLPEQTTQPQITSPPETEEPSMANAAPFSPTPDCPTPQGHREVTATAQISVIYWCTFYFIPRETNEISDTQHQLKLRLRIMNTSEDPTDTINISTSNPSRIRILISEDSYDDYPDGWQPQPDTRRAGDRPELVYIEGAAFWAVPPDVNEDTSGYVTYEESDGTESVSYGHVSRWEPPLGDSLNPGESVGTDKLGTGPLGRGDTSTDVVFTLPGPEGSTINVYGIVLFDIPSNDSPPSDWVLVGECLHTNDEDECFAPPERQMASGFF